MIEDKNIILDHIDNIHVDLSDSPFPNLHALIYLPQGLSILAKSTLIEEENFKGRYRELGMEPPIFSMLGPHENVGALMCYFQWFSVTLINYLDLIATVDFYKRNGISRTVKLSEKYRKMLKKHREAYSAKVCPHILMWRNKIGAHLAITSPRANDNVATLEESVMNSITWEKDSFFTGALKWHANAEFSELPRWSLTEEYEALLPRLWGVDNSDSKK